MGRHFEVRAAAMSLSAMSNPTLALKPILPLITLC